VSQFYFHGHIKGKDSGQAGVTLELTQVHKTVVIPACPESFYPGSKVPQYSLDDYFLLR
jgi:hypothetical protein